MLTDQEISKTIDDKISLAKTAIKSHTYIYVLIMFVVAIALAFIFSRNRGGVAGDLQHQIDSLQKAMVVLKRDRTQDSVNSIRLQHDVDSLKTDRIELVDKIDRVNHNLTTISHQYEKIPNYSKLSNDSLLREFTRRFDYPTPPGN